MWTVKAGLTPTMIIPDYSKQWFYTGDDFQLDKGVPQDQKTKFAEMDEAAHQYAREITNPAWVNYVWVEFLWV